MCIDFEYELNWDLKCGRCGKKPAVNLKDPMGDEAAEGEYKALCEKCGIEVYSVAIVTEWAGTELYLKKYPEMMEAWQ